MVPHLNQCLMVHLETLKLSHKSGQEAIKCTYFFALSLNGMDASQINQPEYLMK